MANRQQVLNDIMSNTGDMARNRGKGHRFKSLVRTKVRTKAKAGNVIKAGGGAAITKAAALIPIPGVGALLNLALDAAITKERDNRLQKHLDSAVKNDKDDQIVKFGIKKISVEELDRYRYKVAHTMELYNKDLTALNATKKVGCKHIVRQAYRYNRIRYRTAKLKEAASQLKAIAELIVAWCDKVDAKTADLPVASNMEATYDMHVDGKCSLYCMVNGRAKPKSAVKAFTASVL